MKPTIEKPKVFISYAWGSQEYQNKVLAFATDLVAAGIDVLFDKWDLKEGHDTYAYMEKCVNDETVTNVIILLDPIYEEKANKRSGGVGTETQIISPEIYNNVSQEKFLPVIFKKKQDGSVPKPQYLKGLLHFDLADDKTYDDSYQRLVKRLYGIYIYQKPELGNIPNWVIEEKNISSKSIVKLEALKYNSNPISQKDDLIDILNQLSDSIVAFDSEQESCLDKYIELQKYRDEYLQVLKFSHSITNSNTLIYEFLEELCSKCNDYDTTLRKEKETLLHEIFIYTVAYYYKQKDYSSLSGLLCKTYFITNPRKELEENGIINFYNYYDLLEYAKKERDDKNYYSGMACHFKDTINLDICTVKEFCFADELCYNFTVFGNTTTSWYWFPIMYVYDGEYNTFFGRFSEKLKSSEWANIVVNMFGFESVQSLKESIKSTVDTFKSSKYNRERFNNSFRGAPQIIDFIEIDDIATLR